MPTETTTDTTDATEVAPTEAEPQEPTATVDDEPLGEAGKRALTAEREARKAAEKRLAEFEAAEQARRESEMTELEKAQAKIAEYERRASEAEAQALIAQIAADTGVPAGLLSGDTEEALRESAAKLLAFKGSAPKAPASDGQGKVGQPIGGVKQLTLNDIKGMTPEQIVEAQATGQLDDVLGVK